MAINGLTEYAPRTRAPTFSPDIFFSYGFRYHPLVWFGSNFAHISYSSLPRVFFFLFSNFQMYFVNNIGFLCYFVLFTKTIFSSCGVCYLPVVRFGSNFIRIFYSSLPRVLFFLFSNFQIYFQTKFGWFANSGGFRFRFLPAVWFGWNLTHFLVHTQGLFFRFNAHSRTKTWKT